MELLQFIRVVNLRVVRLNAARFVISFTCAAECKMPNRSPQEQQAKRQRLAIEGAQAMKEYIADVEATYERTARLRAERLARERAEAYQPIGKSLRKKR